MGYRPFTAAQLAQRAAVLPVVTFPDLPVSDHREQIARAIHDHQVVIVSGETGSGKTTQLPKICLQLGRGIEGLIGHTQPRRLAARSVAERIAEELGQTVGPQPGQVVGYQVRFTDEVGPTTMIKLMTDGILLNEIQLDHELRKYDTIIVDEAHERSLNIDFILGYLARLLPRRPDLKLIITSATIDSKRFAQHFEDLIDQKVPVIEVSGRTYPVEIRYRPLSPDLAAPETADDNKDAVQQLVLEDPDGDLPTFGYGLGDEIDVEQALCEAVDELLHEPDGDILAFFPGERDIREAARALADHLGPRYLEPGAKKHHPHSLEVIPLYARLTAAEQQRIFQPHQTRRIILATNIAETSLTVPGIRYVIDPGLARVSRFSNKTKVQRLPIERVSRASANQRAGRAGRLSDGIAIRLYSEADFRGRDAFTEPEILRTSLASVILQMSALNLGEVSQFPFIDAPSSGAVRDGVQLLVEIGALTDEGRLTPVGRQLAKLPIDPRLGRMLLAGNDNGCASEILVIVAALSIQDVRERPLEAQAASDQAHARFADPTSDFITYLNLWRYLNVQARDLSGSQFRKMCRAEFLHYLRFREWRDVVNQLRQMCRQLKIPVEPLGEPPRSADPVNAVIAFGKGTRSVDFDQVHQALLIGLLSNVGNWDEPKRTYVGARGTRFTVWPGSGLSGGHSPWVMAAELVETSRLFARTVARVKPEWIEKSAAHLVTRNYSEPYWSTGKGAAMIKERVMLYGLTLAADRSVLLGTLGTLQIGAPERRQPTVAQPGTIAAIAQGLMGEGTPGTWASHLLQGTVVVDSLTAAELAREMFIKEGLVKGRFRHGHLAFMQHNQELLEEAKDLEQRSRQPGLVADEQALEDFFAERIPATITSSRAFENWWKKTRPRDPELLNYPWDLLVRDLQETDKSQFPDFWEQDDLRLPLSYDFQPGATSDGVTVTIPLTVLPRVSDQGFDWLVPGMLTELCTGMIRALPKDKRRLLAPAPNVGAEIADRLRKGDIVITPAVTEQPDDPRSLQASLGRLHQWASQKGTLKSGEIPTVTAASAPEPQPEPTTEFLPSFIHAVAALRGIDISPQEAQHAQEHLAAHLQIRFRVTGPGGNTQAEGPSLTELQQRLSRKADVAITKAVKSALQEALTDPHPIAETRPSEWHRDNITEFPDLPRQVESRAPGGVVVRGYPALVADGDQVNLRLLSSADQAASDHRHGVATLLAKKLQLGTARITTRWSGREALLLAASPYPTTEALVKDAQLAAALALTTPDIRTRQDFDQLTAEARDKFEEEVYQILRATIKCLEASSHVQEALSTFTADSLEMVRRAVKRDHKRLLREGFLSDTPRAALNNIPRYLQALALRLQKAAKSPQQDSRKAEELHQVTKTWEQARDRAAARPFSLTTAQSLERLKWLIEELRVSLFAEQLGTSERVSPQRLLRQIDAVA